MDNRKISVNGSITTQADPDANLVAADSVFVTPDPRRARAMDSFIRPIVLSATWENGPGHAAQPRRDWREGAVSAPGRSGRP